MNRPRTSLAERVKWLLWIAAIPLSLALAVAAVMSIARLYDDVRQARDVDAGLTWVDRRGGDPERIGWGDADPGPRVLGRTTREWIADDYLRAFDEVAYALVSGDGSGLRTYFQGAALDDVSTSVAQRVGSGRSIETLDWAHRMDPSFYAPDGATVAFTDVHRYAWGRSDAGDLGDARIGERALQVVMTLDDGTWRVRHWRVVEDRSIVTERSEPRPVPGVEAMRGINYVARSAPFDALWPAFDATEVEADFATVAALGLDTVRFFVPFPAPDGLADHLPTLLDVADRHGLQVVPTLFDGYSAYSLADLPAVDRYLEDLAPLLADPAVRFVDVKNEADRDFDEAGVQRLRSFLGFVLSETARRSGAPVTVGTIEPDPVLAARSDLVSVHHYGDPGGLPARLATAARLGRPVVLEEFGFHTLPTSLPDPHDEGEQARYYAAVLDAAEAAGVGWMAWTLHDLPEGDVPGDRSVERHLGVVRADGSSKPAADVLTGVAPPPATLRDRLAKWLPLLRRAGAAAVVLVGATIAFAVVRRRRRWRRLG